MFHLKIKNFFIQIKTHKFTIYILYFTQECDISSILYKIPATYVFCRVAVTSFSILAFVNLSIFLLSLCHIFRSDLWIQGSFAIVLFIMGRYSSGNSVLFIVSHLSSSWNHVKCLYIKKDFIYKYIIYKFIWKIMIYYYIKKILTQRIHLPKYYYLPLYSSHLSRYL